MVGTTKKLLARHEAQRKGLIMRRALARCEARPDVRFGTDVGKWYGTVCYVGAWGYL